MNIKILVFSDSHGREKNISRALEAHGGRADAVVFLGDGLRGAVPLLAECGIPHTCVRGNCDYIYSGEAYDAMLELGGVRIFCTHGHQYGVKSSLGILTAHARKAEAQLVLFGHTHEPIDTTASGVHLFNPGSVGIDGSYGVVNICDGKIVCGHGTVN